MTLTNVKTGTLNFFKRTFSFLKNGHSLFYYFLFLLLVGVIFFAASLFTNDFTTPFTGDYNTQQYAFYLNVYDDWWHFIKTGSFRLYDTNTYLGVNNIGSNAFYSLFDPLFFIVLISPRSFMGQAMAISTIIRMSLNGFAFYGYLRYMKVSDKSSRLAGLAFAYCGWTAWYLWFNCYTETVIAFVFIIWGVEKILKEKKPWLLMFGLFVAGLINYFFFIAFVMMGFIYAMFRYFQMIKTRNAKENLIVISIGFIGFLAGILMALVVVLPAVMIAINAERVSSANYLDGIKDAFAHANIKEVFDYLFNWKKADDARDYRHIFPVVDFFYPVMSDRGTPLTKFGNETYDNVAGSIFSYYPFVILLVPALIYSCKNKHYSPLIATALFLVSLFTPFCYYLFFGFTKPYSRWTLFVTTSLLTYGAMYLDHIKEEPKWTILAGASFAVIGVVSAAVLAQDAISKNSSLNDRFLQDTGGSLSIPIVAGIAVGYVVLLTIAWYFAVNRKFHYHVLYASTLIEATIMGVGTILGHGTTQYMSVNYGYYKNTELAAVTEKLNKNDKSYFRALSTLAADSAKNDGARNNYNGVSFFHSVYNFNVKNFTYWSKIMLSETGWSGRYVEKIMPLDKFLGLKYYFLEKDRIKGYQPNVPLGFEEITDQYPNNYFRVFEDKEHIDFAISYDNIYIYNPLDGSEEPKETNPMAYGNDSTFAWSVLRNDELYLKGGIVSRQDAEKIMNAAGEDLYLNPSIGSYASVLNTKLIYSKDSSITPWRATHYKASKTKLARDLDVAELYEAIHNDANELTSRPSSNSGARNVIVIRPTDDSCYNENGMIFYLDATYRSNQKEDVYFFDTNGELITYDNHNDDRTSDSSSRRGPRGFYIHKRDNNPAPKVAEIVIVPRYSSYNVRENIFYETYETFYDNCLKNAFDYPIENVHYRDNHFDFTTNFNKKRFVSTQIAYDDGWTIKAKTADGKVQKVDTYIAQGGFVGFLASEGEVSYTMDYYTPYLRGGLYLSSAGFLIFVSTLIGYIYIEDNKYRKTLREFDR